MTLDMLKSYYRGQKIIHETRKEDESLEMATHVVDLINCVQVVLRESRLFSTHEAKRWGDILEGK